MAGGVITIVSPQTKFTDSATPRTPRAGRIHYTKFSFHASGTFHVFKPLFLTSEADVGIKDVNWTSANGVGFQVKTGPDMRWRRTLAGQNDGIFIHRDYTAIDHDTTHEVMIVERESLGCFGLWKESGVWRIKVIDDWDMDYICRLGAANSGSTAYGIIDRLTSAETNWIPSPLIDLVAPIAVGTTLQQTGNSDVIVTARINLTDGTGAGLIVRGTDANNCWKIRFESGGNTVQIIERVAGVDTTRSTSTLSAAPDAEQILAATNYNVTAIADGTGLRCWIAGTLSAHQSYDDYTIGTSSNAMHGAFTEGAGSTIDRLQCYALTQSPPELIMTYPIMAASATTNFSADQTSHVINLPTGISSGDRLLLWFAKDGITGTVTTPTDWTLEGSASTSAADFAYLFSKIATGSEGATVTITSSISESSSAIAMRFTGVNSIQSVVDDEPTSGNGSFLTTTALTPNTVAHAIRVAFYELLGTRTVTWNQPGIDGSLTATADGTATTCYCAAQYAKISADTGAAVQGLGAQQSAATAYRRANVLLYGTAASNGVSPVLGG